MGECSPVTKLSCNGVVVISAFSFGCFGKSSAQLSQVSHLGEDSEFQEGKGVQGRGEGQGPRLCLVILAQCVGAWCRVWRHLIPSTDPARGHRTPMLSVTVVALGTRVLEDALPVVSAEGWLLKLSPCPLHPCHAVFSRRPRCRARAVLTGH